MILEVAVGGLQQHHGFGLAWIKLVVERKRQLRPGRMWWSPLMGGSIQQQTECRQLPDR